MFITATEKIFNGSHIKFSSKKAIIFAVAESDYFIEEEARIHLEHIRSECFDVLNSKASSLPRRVSRLVWKVYIPIEEVLVVYMVDSS